MLGKMECETSQELMPGCCSMKIPLLQELQQGDSVSIANKLKEQ